MWSHCLITFQKVNPLLAPDTVAPYCDCLVDEARSYFKFVDYATSKNTNEKFSEFAETCVQRLGVIVAPTDAR